MINGFYKEYRWLSNFWKAPVMYDGLLYTNNEAAFQSAKCLNKADRYKFQNLEPNEAKKLGLTVELRPHWDEVKFEIMTKIVLDKFMRNPELKQKLIETGNEYLIEGNTWHDNIWGDCSCPKCKNKVKHNNLGKILMEVRKLVMKKSL